jgi:hypothetical protein
VDSDRFFQNYGPNAAQARAAVNAALSTWENTVQDFNFRNVGQPGWAPIVNLYSIGITADHITTCGPRNGRFLGCGGSGSLDGDGKPFNGSLTLDDNGADGGWNFGLNNGAYTNVLNRFAASSGPAGYDLYSVTLHEVGHALGINIGGSLAINNRLSNPGLPAPFDHYRVFTFLDGARAGYTDDGHTWDTTPPAGFPSHPNDLMNPSIGTNTRRLVSDLDATILRDAYGYTITLPSTRVTFLANYNTATGVLTVTGDPGIQNHNITLDVSGSNLVVNVDGVVSQWAVSALSQVAVDSGAGVDTINVLQTPAGVPTTITSRGTSSVVVGKAGRLTNILGTVSVNSSTGSVSLTVDNSADPFRRSVTLDRTHISFGGPGIFYNAPALTSLTLEGGSGGTYTIADTPSAPTTLRTRGSNTVYILGNSSQLNINGQAASDLVRIGDNGRLVNILAPVSVTNSVANATTLVVYNSADTGNRAFTLGPTQISSGGPAISYGMNALLGLYLLGGTGTSTYTITGTPNTGATGVVLETQGNGDRVRVLANTSPVSVNGLAPNRVEVGDNGRLTNIFRDVVISSNSVATDLVSDNSADTIGRTVTITNNTVSYGNPSALLRYSKLASLTVRGGSGGDTFNISSTVANATTTINGGAGNDTFSVGQNDVAGIQGPLVLDGGAGSNSVTVNDQGTSADKYYEIYADAVKRVLNLNPRTYDAVINYANVQTLTVSGGRGSNAFDVESTAAGTSTTVNGGSGTRNDFAVAGNNGLGDRLLGPLAIHGGPGPINGMVYYDYFATAAQTYTLTANMVSRTGLAPVTFDNLVQVILAAASVGGNTINVQGVAAGLGAAFNPANGDTITIGANQSLAAVRGQVAVNPGDNISASVVIDDSSNATPPAGPVTLSNDVTYGFSISGLAPEVIYLSARQNTTLNTSLRTGAGNKTFNVQAAPQGVALTLDAGSGTNTLDYTGYTGNVLANLQTGVATGFSGISNIQNVKGASGGPAGSYNILVGNGGNVLTGGNGRRNLLIAGNNGVRGSTLIGGDQDDILIGGTTVYDTEAGMVSLQAIMSYWAGSGDDYATRVNNLTTGTGVPLLDATTVTGNGLGNTLTGNAGLDLFYGNLALDTYDWDPATETFISV